jgi:DNA-binding NtrC family response regulator
MSRMAVVCDSDLIEESDLPYDFALAPQSAEEPQSEEQSLELAMIAFEKSFLRKALKKNQWNKKRTAEQLQIGYSTLKSKLKTYGLGHEDEED